MGTTRKTKQANTVYPNVKKLVFPISLNCNKASLTLIIIV